jgi:hypothetical protein
MRYEEARQQIANGDLLFFRGTALHSRIIQRWTRSCYSHVGVALWVKAAGRRDRLCVIEAIEGRGIRVEPLRIQLEQGNAVDWFQLVDGSIDRERVADWALDRWGLEYASARQLLRSFVTVPLCSLVGLPTRIDKDRWFCSYFAASALRHGGWNPPADDRVPPELAAPGDVALFTCLHRVGPLTLAQG